jgi:hypothetical protein
VPVYPSYLQPYMPYITVTFFFIDGLFFGLAARSNIRGIVLLFVGLIVAEFISLLVIAIVDRSLLSAIVHAGIHSIESVGLSSLVLTFGAVLWVIGFSAGWLWLNGIVK